MATQRGLPSTRVICHVGKYFCFIQSQALCGSRGVSWQRAGETRTDIISLRKCTHSNTDTRMTEMTILGEPDSHNVFLLRVFS